jgi:hypothetical protein
MLKHYFSAGAKRQVHNMEEEKSINTDSPGDEEKSIEIENQGNKVDEEKSSKTENQGIEERIWRMKRIWRKKRIWRSGQICMKRGAMIMLCHTIRMMKVTKTRSRRTQEIKEGSLVCFKKQW